MRPQIFGAVFVALCLLFLACQTGSSTYSQADLDAAEAEVASVLDEFWAVWSAAAFDEGMGYYSDDPDLTFVTDGYVWESKSAVDAGNRAFFEALERQNVDITRSDIHALTPEIVLVTQTAQYTQTDHSGNTTPIMDFTGSFVWVREGGEWKAISFHNSMANPMPATLKSVHLLNVPSPTDEAAYTLAVADLNEAIRSAGYAGNGYEMWRLAETQSPDASPVGFGLLLEGIWTDQETYDAIHELGAYEAFEPETLDLFQRVSAGERYTRYQRIPVGGPGEG